MGSIEKGEESATDEVRANKIIGPGLVSASLGKVDMLILNLTS